MGVAQATDTDQLACQKLLAELKALNDELSVPTLAQFGVNRQEFMELLPVMADQALASGSPKNNPRVPDKEQLIALYRALW
ncbi:MAG: iron-containing alcohol dehydrogenase, partial [Oceanospirillaceae bacterium]|nr:iron-containing alcohol dehydrogenase [Oceanospirillaceae bacterium]